MATVPSSFFRLSFFYFIEPDIQRRRRKKKKQHIHIESLFLLAPQGGEAAPEIRSTVG